MTDQITQATDELSSGSAVPCRCTSGDREPMTLDTATRERVIKARKDGLTLLAVQAELAAEGTSVSLGTISTIAARIRLAGEHRGRSGLDPSLRARVAKDLAAGRSLAQVAEKWGVSKSTAFKIRKAGRTALVER